MKNIKYLILFLILLNFTSVVYCSTQVNSGKVLYRLADPTGPTSAFSAANGW